MKEVLNFRCKKIIEAMDVWIWYQNDENKLDGKEIKPKSAKYDAEAKTDCQIIEKEIQFIRHIIVLNIMEGKINGKKGRR